MYQVQHVTSVVLCYTSDLAQVRVRSGFPVLFRTLLCPILGYGTVKLVLSEPDFKFTSGEQR